MAVKVSPVLVSPAPACTGRTGTAGKAPVSPVPPAQQRERSPELAASLLAERVIARINVQPARGTGYYSEIMQLKEAVNKLI